MSTGSSTRQRGQLVEYGDFLTKQLGQARLRIKMVDLITAGVVVAVAAAAYVLCMAVLDQLFVLSTAARMISLAGFTLAAVAYIVFAVAIPATRRINELYVAHEVERASPDTKNSLLNWMLLRSHRKEISPIIMRAIEKRAASDLAKIPLHDAINSKHLVHASYVLASIVVLFCAYTFFTSKELGPTLQRVLFPLSEVAPPTETKLVDIQPGDSIETAGDNVAITALVSGKQPDRVRLYYQAEGDDYWAHMDLDPPVQEFGTWKVSLTDLQRTFRYYLNANDFTSDTYLLQVTSAPLVQDWSVTYRYPDYTGQDPYTENKGDIEGLEGTVVRVTVKTNVPAKSGWLLLNVGAEPEQLRMDPVPETSNQLFAEFKLTQDGSYQVDFTDYEGRRPRTMPVKNIRVHPDLAPVVQFVEPAEPQISVPANGNVRFRLSASDEYGLNEVTMHWRVDGKPEKMEQLKFTGTDEEPLGLSRLFIEQLDLSSYGLKEGDVVDYWAEAVDNRMPTPNRADTRQETRRLVITKPVEEKEQQQDQQQQAKADDREEDAPRPDGAQEKSEQQRPEESPEQPQDQPNDQRREDGEPGEGQKSGEQSKDGGETDSAEQDPDQERLEKLKKLLEERQKQQEQKQQQEQEKEQSEQGGQQGDAGQQQPQDQPSDSQESEGAQDRSQAGEKGDQKESGEQKQQPSEKDQSGSQQKQKQDGEQGEQKQADDRKSSDSADQTKREGASDSKDSDSKDSDSKSGDAADQNQQKSAGEGSADKPRQEQPAGAEEDGKSAEEKQAAQPKTEEKQQGEQEGAKQEQQDQAKQEGAKQKQQEGASQEQPQDSEQKGQEGAKQGEQQGQDSAGQEGAQEQPAAKDGSQEAAQKQASEKGEQPEPQQADGQQGASEKASQEKGEEERSHGDPDKSELPSDQKQENPRASDNPADGNSAPGESPPKPDEAQPGQEGQKSGEQTKGPASDDAPKPEGEPQEKPAEEESRKEGAKDASASEQGNEDGQSTQGDESTKGQSSTGSPSDQQGDNSESQGEQKGQGQSESEGESQAGQKGEEGEQGQQGQQGQGEKGPQGEGEKGQQGEQPGGEQESAGEGKGEGKQGEGQDQKGEGGEGQKKPGDSDQGDSGATPGAGGEGGGGASQSDVVDNTGDQADTGDKSEATPLNFALENAAEGKNTDQDLLKELGMTDQEFQDFAKRMLDKQDAPQIEETPDPLSAQQREFGADAKIRTSSVRESGRTVQDGQQGMFGGRRVEPPAEYRQLFEAYSKSIGESGRAAGKNDGAR